MGAVKLTPELMAQAMAEVDWDKIDAMTDEDIEQQIADNPDAAPILNEKQQIGGMIQTIRRKLKMPQKAFAESFHLSIHALRDWEQGRVALDSAIRAKLKGLWNIRSSLWHR